MKLGEILLSILALIVAGIYMTGGVTGIGDALLHVAIYCAGAVTVVVLLILLIFIAIRLHRMTTKRNK